MLSLLKNFECLLRSDSFSLFFSPFPFFLQPKVTSKRISILQFRRQLCKPNRYKIRACLFSQRPKNWLRETHHVAIYYLLNIRREHNLKKVPFKNV